MDTKQVVARFEAERQALALMNHPNIAKALDGGATETGRPYFVMELVQGVPITEFCDKNRYSVEQRIKLFIPVCQAIQSAHQKGVIHRDIKPSNILVTLHDGVPVPIVIDFGVAKATQQKLTEKTLFTNFATMIGTPAYMSPEQAEMSGLDIDTRSDIYGLGVLLYELLTGTTPFPEKRLRSASYHEMQRIILEEEPERPSTRLRRKSFKVSPSSVTTTSYTLFTDLDWIVMKCLEKDRARRYETANGLATDLNRFLENEPVLARPPSAAYKFQKAIRRNKLAFGAVGAVVAALTLGLGVSTWWFLKESEARETARRNLYVSDMNVAKLAWDAGNLGRAQELLDRHRPVPGQADMRGFEWRYLWNLCRPAALATLTGQAGPVYGIALSPDGKTLATAHGDGTVKLSDMASRQEIATLLGHLDSVLCVAFSPDGTTLASGGRDNTTILWNIASRTKLGLLKGHSDWIRSVAFSPDGKTLVTAGRDHLAKLWNVATRLEKNTLRGHSNILTSVAFSPDGKTFATGSRDGSVKFWDPATGRETGSLDARRMFVWSVAFSPDGGMLAAGLDDGSVRVWDMASRRVLASLTGHRSVATSVGFSPDGQTLATGSLDNTLRLWNTRLWTERTVLRGHVAPISALAFTPDSRTVISGSYDKTAKIWDASPPPTVSSFQAHALSCSVEISPDGNTIASTSSDGTIKLWDIKTFAELATFQGHTRQVGPLSAFSNDGRMLASETADHAIKLWDIASRKELATFAGHGDTVYDLSFLPDGRSFVSCGFDRTIRFWDLRSSRQLAGLKFESVVVRLALSKDGRLLASECFDGTVTVFDASSRAKKLAWRAHDGEARVVAFSPDGELLATGSWDGTVKLWNLRTLAPVVLRVPVVNDLAFSPDGKTLVTGSADKTIRFWNLGTNQEVLALPAHMTGVDSVRFSPRGDLLVTSGVDGMVKLWAAPSLEQIDATKLTQGKRTL
jgi:WD40 repeat protein